MGSKCECGIFAGVSNRPHSNGNTFSFWEFVRHSLSPRWNDNKRQQRPKNRKTQVIRVASLLRGENIIINKSNVRFRAQHWTDVVIDLFVRFKHAPHSYGYTIALSMSHSWVWALLCVISPPPTRWEESIQRMNWASEIGSKIDLESNYV